jgi:hypothetical protein
MSTVIAALLFGVVQTGATNVDVTNLSGLFEATCLDGQAKLSAGEIVPVTFDQLPSALRDSLGRPASGKIWQLNTSGRAYLYVLDYAGGPGVSPKVCGLAADTMDLGPAANALEMRVTGAVDRNKARSTQWVNARDGYVATATRAASYSVLQIGWMSDADHEAALVQTQQLPH